ncbi:MAG: Ku protein [Thermoleophilia bacterium]
MRAIWKGAIQFGLVTIPIRLYTGTEDRSVGFHQLHAEDLGRIRYRRVCEVCGRDVDYADIIKGYELDGGRYVPLTDEELESVPAPSGRAVEISSFVEMEQIDPMYYQRTYYLAPEEIGAKAYQLLRETLERTGKAAVAKIAIREKEHLALIRPKGEALVLETMYWPDEIRDIPSEELHPDVQIREPELKMAENLIESLTEEWDPTAFKDEYREALMEIIERKAAGQEIEAPPEPEAAPVIDLMEALKASVEAAKTTRAARKKSAAAS